MASNVAVLNFNDVSKTGLDLTFTTFKKISNNAAVSAPIITELGNGFYKFGFDLETVDSDIYYVATDGDTNTLTGILNKSNNDALADLINRLLGLCYENQYIDMTVYDGNGNLTSSRVRTYSNADSVGTDADVLAIYGMTATYSGNAMQTFEVIKV